MAEVTPVALAVDEAGVAVVTMRDLAGRNALSHSMIGALEDTFATIANRRDIRTVVLAGLPEYFSTGASLTLLHGILNGEISSAEILLPRLLLECPVPCIAALEGHAVGGGFALGLCADIVIISQQKRYALNFMNMGFTPGMGTTRLLEHVLSPAIAHELLFTGEARLGRTFEGKSGINHIVPAEEVLPLARDLAARIAEKPRTALVALKRTLSLPRRMAFEQGRTFETHMHEITFAQRDVARWIEDQHGGEEK